MEEDSEVQLGFLEPSSRRLLTSRFFPSKVGGKPAWLALKPLPSTQSLLCAECQKPLAFLLQIYAPLDDNADAFHRTLFVFSCRNGPCLSHSGSIKVFRSQLPRKNPFYPFEPPDEEAAGASSDEDQVNASEHDNTCKLCGITAGQRCSGCKAVFYCCREHQLEDWHLFHQSRCTTLRALSGQSGGGSPPEGLGEASVEPSGATSVETAMGGLSVSHESADVTLQLRGDATSAGSESEPAGGTGAGRAQAVGAGPAIGNGARGDGKKAKKKKKKKGGEGVRSSMVFPEFEVVIEPEEVDEDAQKNFAKEQAMLEEYHRKQKAKEGPDDAEHDYDMTEKDVLGVGAKDATFIKFQQVIVSNPEQVVRYCRSSSAQPVWVTDRNQCAASEVPCCSCGSKRTFEFQVLPQLLYFLKVDDLAAGGVAIDWATLAFYTCDRSCSPPQEHAYIEEFVWRQPPATL